MNTSTPSPLSSPFSEFLRSTPRALRSLLVVAALASPALAQDLTVKAPAQTRPIAIVNATIHPVSGPDIASGHIVFENGKITRVGEGPFTLDGGTVIDATGRHVYPGLIGPVTQIGLSEFPPVRATQDQSEQGSIKPEVFAAVAVNPDSTLIPVTRANGILTVGSFPTGGTIPGRASVMQLEGWTWEEMTVEAGAGLVINWPQMRPVSSRFMNQTDEEQQQTTRRTTQALDEAFDAAAAYLAARGADPARPTDLRWEGMAPFLPTAGPAQKPVLIFAQDADQIHAAVAWAVQRRLRPVIIGGRDAPLAAEALKRHDVPVIVTGTLAFPKRSDSDYDGAYRLPAELEALGIRWCLASADDTAHERNLPYNAAMSVAYGLDPAAALRGVTRSTSEILGVGDRLGSLEPGKLATLIVTDGNPLEVTTRIERAFIAGREIDLSSKQSKLADKYREKYRQLNGSAR